LPVERKNNKVKMKRITNWFLPIGFKFIGFFSFKMIFFF
jgi:hypothetical protein